MESSMKMGLVLALGAIALGGCATDDASNSSTGGSANGGSATGGGTTGGSSAGGASSGGSGGSIGGAAGSGTGANGGAATGGTAGAAAGGQTGNGGAGGGIACDYGATGIGGASGATTAVVLLDDVVLTDAGGTSIVAQWQFADATTIVDSTTDTGDKWTRSQWAPLNDNTGAADTFLDCDGNPAVGSLENVVPFGSEAVANRYYEVHVPFAPADYHGHHVTAKVKLAAGAGACAPRALLFTILGEAPYTAENGTAVDLVAGQWIDLSLDVPTAFTVTDQIGFRITWQGC